MGEILHHNSGVLIPRDEYEELAEAMATVMRIGSRFTPLLIERLDLIDGDPDIEEDDPCGQIDEDEHNTLPLSVFGTSGPGCELSDPDCGVDDKGEEISAEDSFQCFAADGPGCPIADPDANWGTEC